MRNNVCIMCFLDQECVREAVQVGLRERGRAIEFERAVCDRER